MDLEKTQKNTFVILGLMFFALAAVAVPTNYTHAGCIGSPGRCETKPECEAICTSEDLKCVQDPIVDGWYSCINKDRADGDKVGFGGQITPDVIIPDSFIDLLNTVLAPVFYAVWGLASLLLWLSAVILDFVITHMVVGMANLIQGANGINLAWGVIRDVMNMAFIFILLYISITTILRVGGNTRQWLTRLIIAGLLINFSLFFTKVVIDASNILANEFYQGILSAGEQSAGSEEGTLSSATTLTGVFMRPLLIASFYKVDGGSGVFEPAADSPSSLLSENSGQNFLGLAAGGTVIALILSFVFLAGALFLIIRFALLVLLMVLSPLPFVAWVLPGTAKYSKQWWDTLLNQAFYAPIYFALLYVSALIIGGGAISTAITSAGGATPDTQSFSSLFTGTRGAIGLVVNFGIIIVFLVASIVIAKSMASTGAKGAVKWASKTAGAVTFGGAAFLGREGVGRVGQKVAESKWANRLAARGGALGFAGAGVVGAGKKVEKSSIDLRSIAPVLDAGTPKKGGFKKQQEDRIKRKEGYLKAVGSPGEEASAAEAQARLELTNIASRLDDDEIRAAKERDAELTKAREDLEKTNEKLDAAVTARANAQTDEQRDRLDQRIAQLNNTLRQNTDALGEARDSYDDLSGTQRQYINVSGQYDAALKAVGQQTRGSQVAEAERGLGSRSESRRKASENIRKELSRSKEDQGTERIIEAIRTQQNQSGNP